MKLKPMIAISVLLLLAGAAVYQYLDEQSASEDDSEVMFVQPEGVDVDLEGVDVGDVAPDFQLETLEGETIRLSDLKGKKVMLNFWATWCPPCRAEMPHMDDFQTDYEDEDVVVLAVNALATETDISSVTSFVDEFDGFSFPILLDETLEVNTEYQAVSMPTTYFINTEGIVQTPRHVGPLTYEDMEKRIAELD